MLTSSFHGHTDDLVLLESAGGRRHEQLSTGFPGIWGRLQPASIYMINYKLSFRQQLLKYANTYSLLVEDSLAARARPPGGVPRVVVTKTGVPEERLNSCLGCISRVWRDGESK